MNCEKMKELLIGHLYEALDDASEAELSAHLAVCSGCRADLEDLGQTRRWLGEAASPVPRFTPRVLVFSQPVLRRPLFAFAAGFACAVLLLGAGLAAGWNLARPGETPGPIREVNTVSPQELDRTLSDYQARFDRTLNDRINEVAARQPAPDSLLTRDELKTQLASFGQLLDFRRASELDYVLDVMQAMEHRADTRIGETEQTVRYLILASDPRLSER